VEEPADAAPVLLTEGFVAAGVGPVAVVVVVVVFGVAGDVREMMAEAVKKSLGPIVVGTSVHSVVTQTGTVVVVEVTALVVATVEPRLAEAGGDGAGVEEMMLGND
jgi:hypothetical protein